MKNTSIKKSKQVSIALKNMAKEVMQQFNTPLQQQYNSNLAVIQALIRQNEALVPKIDKEQDLIANRLDKKLPDWRKYISNKA